MDFEKAINIDDVDVEPVYSEGEKELFLIGLLENANGSLNPAALDYIKEKNEIVVSFIVEPEGNVSNVQVLTKDGFVFDEVFSRTASSMPKWEPGWVDGRKVRVAVKLSLEIYINR